MLLSLYADVFANSTLMVFIGIQRTPLQNLKTVQQPWSVASAKTVAGDGGFGYFSAVCWIFGREIYDSLTTSTISTTNATTNTTTTTTTTSPVPIGLVSNNWGGTPVESWTTPETLAACNVTTVDSILYNAMIHPYTIGPMALRGFTWYQGA